jgi:transposase
MSAGLALQKENESLKAEVNQLSSRIEELSAQVKWFQNQLFGQKSERRIPVSSPDQLYLGQQFQDETAPVETETVKEHQRKKRKTQSEDGDDQKLFFDPDVVPVEDIAIDNPEIEGLSPEEYEVVSQKVSYRLAQKPGVFVILRYTRDVIKKLNPMNDEKKIFCPSLPPEVFEKSHADVSFLAGLLIDKFQYHLPLYRQHHRLQAAGIDVSRAWLTQLVHRCGDLLRPIFDALVKTIRLRR